MGAVLLAVLLALLLAAVVERGPATCFVVVVAAVAEVVVVVVAVAVPLATEAAVKAEVAVAVGTGTFLLPGCDSSPACNDCSAMVTGCILYVSKFNCIRKY